jgi:hypothetical protein
MVIRDIRGELNVESVNSSPLPRNLSLDHRIIEGKFVDEIVGLRLTLGSCDGVH